MERNLCSVPHRPHPRARGSYPEYSIPIGRVLPEWPGDTTPLSPGPFFLPGDSQYCQRQASPSSTGPPSLDSALRPIEPAVRLRVSATDRPALRLRSTVPDGVQYVAAQSLCPNVR